MTSIHQTSRSKGSKVWIPSNGVGLWERGTVLKTPKPNQPRVFVKTADGRHINTSETFLVNPTVEDDMTSLWYIHEPAILFNLEQRSLQDKPYTLLGPVLVAVNPLRQLKNPKVNFSDDTYLNALANKPHPYAIAERAYRQLGFACNQVKLRAKSSKSSKSSSKKKRSSSDQEEDPIVVNQSVVVGGESGAGKTESSKMVLRHLVGRGCTSDDDVKEDKKLLDKKLLGSNPILESFGNASTLRNHNSSRFGKFMKIHFSKDGKAIRTASIETYLLERSRITTHEAGERGYHVFYQMLVGASKAQKKQWKLDPKKHYAYLAPAGSKDAKPSVNLATDKANFQELVTALGNAGMQPKVVANVFNICAAVLQMGNLAFGQDNNDRAYVEASCMDLVDDVARLLGVDADTLIQTLTQKKVNAGGERMVTYHNAKLAAFVRDAMARAIYSRLFDWLVKSINESFSTAKVREQSAHDPFIGVLDIFGFESFLHNDFEQLLINYTNESLQATFNDQIFKAEAELYRREGLAMSDEEQAMLAKPPDNSECMELLQSKQGILATITAQGEMPDPSDKKMLAALHERFTLKTKSYAAIHPKQLHVNFAVEHYAGQVTYTVGRFLQKNKDVLPAEMEALLAKSSHPIVSSMAAKETTNDAADRPGPRKKKSTSLVAGFQKQISALIDTLGATSCLFIRCIKPNAPMEREGDSMDWFDRKYVTSQLKSLSVPQTAMVLKSGFPTRLSYDTLMKSYKHLLPKEAIKSWKVLGGKSEQSFVAALFYGFKIDRGTYKLGLSKVFFRSNMFDKLNSVLQSAATWDSKSKKLSGSAKKEKQVVIRRIRKYHARRRWRVCFAMVSSALAFRGMVARAMDRYAGVSKLQAQWRTYRARKEYTALQHGAVVVQSLYRGRKGREIAAQQTVELQKQLQRDKRKASKMAKEAAKKKKARAKAKAEAARKVAEVEKRLQQQKKIDGDDDDDGDGADENSKGSGSGNSGKKKKSSMSSSKANKRKSVKRVEIEKELARAKRRMEKEQELERNASKELEMATEERELLEKSLHDAFMKMEEDMKRREKELKLQMRKTEAMIARKMEEQLRQESKEEAKAREKTYRKRRSMAILQQATNRAEARKSLAKTNKRKSMIQSNKRMSLRAGMLDLSTNARSGNSQVEKLHALGEATFWATKLAVRSRRNWKRRFLVLNLKDRTLSYYSKQGKGKANKPKGVFTLNPRDAIPGPEVRSVPGFVQSKRFVVKLCGGKLNKDPRYNNLTMFLSFDSEVEKQDFMKACELAVFGEIRQDIERKMNDLELSKSKRDDDSDNEEPEEEEGVELSRDAVFAAMMGLDETALQQLDDLDQMLDKGEITEDQYDKLLPTIIPFPEDEVWEDLDGEEEEEFGIQIRCPGENCGVRNNTKYGTHCRKCGAELLSAFATDSLFAFGDDDSLYLMSALD